MKIKLKKNQKIIECGGWMLKYNRKWFRRWRRFYINEESRLGKNNLKRIWTCAIAYLWNDYVDLRFESRYNW